MSYSSATVGTNRRLQSPMAMGSADLGMTPGPSTGYHVTLGKCLPSLGFCVLSLQHSSSFRSSPSRNHSRQGCNAPTLFLPDSSLSYPGRLASMWPPLNQSKPGQTSSKRPLSFLASETLPPEIQPKSLLLPPGLKTLYPWGVVCPSYHVLSLTHFTCWGRGGCLA